METDNLDLTGPVCRACLKLGAKNNIFSVHKGTSKQYFYIFNSCFSIKVEPEDGLPKYICRMCLNKVIKFYKFKNAVTQNDSKLREILKRRINEHPKNVENAIKSENNAVGRQLQSSKYIDASSIPKGDSLILNDNVDEKNHVKTEPEDSKDQFGFDRGFDSTGYNSEGFDDTEELNEKLPITNEEKGTHQCDICGKILSCKSNLKQHIRKHTGERPYGCDICGKKFFKAEHVAIHKRIHTGERPHSCTICSKTFIQYAALKVHLRTHSGERPHMCSVCGKSFSQSSNLVYHMRTHSGETPFTCKLCGKGFKNAGNLNIHKRFHDNERPFGCKMCEKRFVTSSHLNVHIKQHNGEKCHKCIVCGKAFVRSEHLKAHLIIHTGQKPHACTLCPKRYTQNSHLNRHMKTHKDTV